MPATVRALCLALLALCAQPAVAVQPLLTCDFGSYPAEPAPAENTPLRIDNEFARTFRTQLSKAAQQPPDFAGTQHLVTWGCGTGCIEGGLVDATSGRAHPLPFSLHRGIQEPLPPLQYQINSRLLVASGARSEQEEGSPLHCYQFTNGALKPLTACPCAPLATDADLGRIDGEVRTCAAEHATDEGAFSACLLAASRHDITRLKQQVEALGGSWHMAMDSDDQRLVERWRR